MEDEGCFSHDVRKTSDEANAAAKLQSQDELVEVAKEQNAKEPHKHDDRLEWNL